MRKSITPWYTWVLLALTTAGSLNAGDPDAALENQRLAGIEQELQLLERLSYEAEATTDRSARVRFNYPVLRRHLQLMRTAVQDHLLAAAQQPRELPEIEVIADGP